jgi:electron transfer flavoprotein-quinone oxidoreductase
MLSAKLAAQTIVEAAARDDFSAAALSRYRELLDESVVIQDLYTIRNVTDFAHARPHLLRDYPELASVVARTYLTVDGTPKRAKQQKIAAMLKAVPKKRLLGDAIGALRAFR